MALGAGSTATRANAVEVGGRQVTGVAAGTQATDAVNLGQLQAAIAGAGGVDSGAILNDAKGRRLELGRKAGGPGRRRLEILIEAF